MACLSLPFNRKSSFGSRIWYFVLTLRRRCMIIFVYFCLLLRGRVTPNSLKVYGKDNYKLNANVPTLIIGLTIFLSVDGTPFACMSVMEQILNNLNNSIPIDLVRLALASFAPLVYLYQLALQTYIPIFESVQNSDLIRDLLNLYDQLVLYEDELQELEEDILAAWVSYMSYLSVLFNIDYSYYMNNEDMYSEGLDRDTSLTNLWDIFLDNLESVRESFVALDESAETVQGLVDNINATYNLRMETLFPPISLPPILHFFVEGAVFSGPEHHYHYVTYSLASPGDTGFLVETFVRTSEESLLAGTFFNLVFSLLNDFLMNLNIFNYHAFN